MKKKNKNQLIKESDSIDNVENKDGQSTHKNNKKTDSYNTFKVKSILENYNDEEIKPKATKNFIQ
jgi:hypothetical protein